MSRLCFCEDLFGVRSRGKATRPMQGMQVTRKKEKEVMKSDHGKTFFTAPHWLNRFFFLVAVGLSILGVLLHKTFLHKIGSICMVRCRSRLSLSFTVQFLCSDFAFSVSFLNSCAESTAPRRARRVRHLELACLTCLDLPCMPAES